MEIIELAAYPWQISQDMLQRSRNFIEMEKRRKEEMNMKLEVEMWI